MEVEGRGTPAEIVEKVCEGLRRGTPMTVVCRELGQKPDTMRSWRLKDVNIANAFDEAFEYGMDMIAQRTRLTARGIKPAYDENGHLLPTAGESTGFVDRDKLVIWNDHKLIANWDTRYRRTIALANDPVNPLTDVRPPAQLTDDQLMAIANGAAKESPTDG